jgi:hypothetical protein
MLRKSRELRLVAVFVGSFLVLGASSPAPNDLGSIANPILFVTQVPNPSDFTTIGSVFGNHLPDVDSAPRGGDLMIRYPDGTLKNLTKLAGYGMDGLQGANSIAVREPSVHWSGTKALFSMVIGAPTEQYVRGNYRWQLYEVSGLGRNETPVITRVPNQPQQFNNVSPVYGTDDRIIFTSDRPRDGSQHLHPQLDEYEEAPTVSGLWSLDPSNGDLRLLDHSPSGDFTPSVDSFGRVIFTRWDHLQRDQQADSDLTGAGHGTFNYSDESATATKGPATGEVFPEPRAERRDLIAGTNLVGHSFNHFFPWQVHEDGRELETLNHVGRHEFHDYFDRSLNDDPGIREFISVAPQRFNQNDAFNILQMREDPRNAGTYYAVDAPEFRTHAAGQIISFAAPPTLPADRMEVKYVTDKSTAGFVDDGATPPAGHSGLYRNPLPLSDGTLVASHTVEKRQDRNEGTRERPRSRYDFRLKTLRASGGSFVADQPLTAGLTKSLSWWDPDVMVTYDGPLWELDPVEVRPRQRPLARTVTLERPEADIFAEEGVSEAEMSAYLKRNNLALIVSRDVTSRDAADRQQPFNLKVDGSDHQTVGGTGKLYTVRYMEMFQADQIRGIGGTESPTPGRRVLAQRMHDPLARNPVVPGAPPGGVKVAPDGSVAALVPAQRAMTWQLSDPNQVGVVRERYWVTFQPGEIRVCASCHGLNSVDQASRGVPMNKPEALRELLRFYKTTLKTPGRPRTVRR